MEVSSYFLYPIMIAILAWMWIRVRGMTIEEIVKKSADEHHVLLEIAEHHPYGGNSTEYSEWVKQHHH